MPQLSWNESDVLGFFRVEPVVADYEVSHLFEVEREGLRLSLQLWHLESVIQAAVFRRNQTHPLFSVTVFVRGEARVINDKRGRYLALEDCIVASNRFAYLHMGDPFDRERFPGLLTLKVAIDPDIQLSLDHFQSRT